MKVITDLSNIKDNGDFKFLINENDIEELNHEDYRGKRILIKISDKFGNSEEIKLDIGVNINTDIYQNEILLDTSITDDVITFLANPIEQIIVEKLMPIVKFRELSVRYKDIFDIYWLINNKKVSKDLLMLFLNRNIFSIGEVSNLNILVIILKEVFKSTIYINGVKNSNNWLDINIETIFESIIHYFEALEEKVEI